MGLNCTLSFFFKGRDKSKKKSLADFEGRRIVCHKTKIKTLYRLWSTVDSPGRRKRKREEQPDQDSGLGSSCSLSLVSSRARLLQLDQASSRQHPRTSCSEETGLPAPGSPSNLSDQEFADARSEPGHSSGELFFTPGRGQRSTVPRD
jgi:hypothetical protein